MLTRVVLSVAASAALASLAGCSGNASTPSDKSPAGTSLGAVSVGSRGDLPACNPSTEATVAYVVDEKAIVACVSGTWTPVVFGSGPQGAPGAAGANGVTGATGPAGDPGATGADGAAGSTGATGVAGSTGETGAKGDQGDQGATGAPGVGLSSLIVVTAVAPGDPHCDFGGMKISVGVDDDGNGVLAVSEVDQTAYVCDATPPVRVRKVFVTSQAWSGALGGVLGADQKCQETADTVPSFSGKTFKAWISETGSSPSDRFTKDGRFVRMDGIQIAPTWERFSDAYYIFLDAPISVDEQGAKVSAATRAWNSTQFDGTPYGSAYDCAEWTDATSASSGLTGTPTASSSLWSEADVVGCDQAQRLYCFEQ